MRKLSERLNFIMDGGSVTRFHTRPTIGNQTNAEHQWGTAVLLILIFGEESVSKKLLIAALHHDVCEIEYGDIPSPAKQKWPLLRAECKKADIDLVEEYGIIIEIDLCSRDQLWLVIVDLLECYLYSWRQYDLGNTNLRYTGNRCRRRILEFLKADDLGESEYGYRIKKLCPPITSWSKL